MKVREVIWPIIPALFRAQAVTLYPFVIYRSYTALNQYRAHELVHVEQIRREGWFDFYCSYICYHFQFGYDKNPYEVEARNKAGV